MNISAEDTFLFLGGFILAMGLLHLVLYFYNRHKRANLYYGVGLIMVFMNFTMVELSTDPSFNSTTQKTNIVINSATNGILLYFVCYYVFASLMPALQKILKVFAGFYIVAVSLLAALSPDAPYLHVVTQILRAVVYVSTLAICIFGLIERIPNFFLIVISTLLLLVTEAFAGVDVFRIWDGPNPYPPLRTTFILIGYSLPFLTYSVYLSKELAVISKKLTRELIMNERLTREKYEQEVAIRKLLEAQNLELEKNVLERTREISSQKEELKVQSERIIELDKLKTKFFANISHEFRTPLTLILGPLEKRLASEPDGENKQGLSIMKRNALRLLNLVNQLLDFARLDGGSVRLRAGVLDMHELLNNVTTQFQSLAESKDIRFATHLMGSIPVHADREMLTKILNNLISNAFKFTPRGGSITLLARKGGPDDSFSNGFAEIQVVDTGIGIPQEELPMIFDRFYQVGDNAARKIEGSGIGLALSKELVELHGGKIFVSSAPSGGTCFTIQLPLIDSLQTGEEENGPAIMEPGDFSLTLAAPLTASTTTADTVLPKILLVEDNDDMRFYLHECLKEKFAILEAADGDEGVAIALKAVPDLIVSDVMMAGADGIKLCNVLKGDEKTSHIPIILLTARVGVHSRIEGYQVGADAYIPKPFDADELNVRIENLIENRKRLQKKLVNHFFVQPSPVVVSSMEERFISKVIECIEARIGDSDFSVEVLADAMGMSSVQIYRKLKALTGESPNDLIRNMRLDRASNILKQRGGNVADVAFQVGFANLSYFSKCFKERFNMTPRELLKTALL